MGLSAKDKEDIRRIEEVSGRLAGGTARLDGAVGTIANGRYVPTPIHMVEAYRVAGPKALEKLLYMMENADNQFLQVACANSILDRGFGKAVILQHITHREEQAVDISTLSEDNKRKMVEIIRESKLVERKLDDDR